MLNYSYSINRYPTSEDRVELAKLVGLTEAQVKIWFQHRRSKEKKNPDDIPQFPSQTVVSADSIEAKQLSVVSMLHTNLAATPTSNISRGNRPVSSLNPLSMGPTFVSGITATTDTIIFKMSSSSYTTITSSQHHKIINL